ncbi:hypothetical protein VNO77_18340 [Canavalia gladiata]|uniref:Uncharacterized protein n=1 Tax=Canavalia gladiata TaxID=3824 RepID=A0AAN9LP94_CANGL
MSYAESGQPVKAQLDAMQVIFPWLVQETSHRLAITDQLKKRRNRGPRETLRLENMWLVSRGCHSNQHTRLRISWPVDLINQPSIAFVVQVLFHLSLILLKGLTGNLGSSSPGDWPVGTPFRNFGKMEIELAGRNLSQVSRQAHINCKHKIRAQPYIMVPKVVGKGRELALPSHGGESLLHAIGCVFAASNVGGTYLERFWGQDRREEDNPDKQKDSDVLLALGEPDFRRKLDSIFIQVWL